MFDGIGGGASAGRRDTVAGLSIVKDADDDDELIDGVGDAQ
jgi:hypothetical protein